MKRLLLFCGLVIAARPVGAHKPGEPIPLPCSVEQGKYIVTVETAAGPRRFVFDTGCPQTIVCEKLCDELRLAETGRRELGDFEGFRASVTTARLPYLRMGGTTFRDRPVNVLPDSSYIFRCLHVDGLVGSDLLGQFAVRFTDSTLTLARDYRDFGGLSRKKALRIYSRRRPIIAFRAGSGKDDMDFYGLFDSGSSTCFSCRYFECSALIERGILHDVRQTVGYRPSMGWTNRSAAREAVRGVIPALKIGGATLKRVPVEETHGGTNKIGLGLLRYGTVVIDYRKCRFWFLPHAEAHVPPPATIYNVMLALSGNRLIVGQLWDESLAGIVSPGDQVLRIGTLDVSQIDPCAFIRSEIRGDKPEITVRRSDGTVVKVAIKKW